MKPRCCCIAMFRKLPERQRKMLENLHQGVLEGKKVLLVDDDIRNIFAMTSVLERFKMNVVSAENGKDAIQSAHGQCGH